MSTIGGEHASLLPPSARGRAPTRLTTTKLSAATPASDDDERAGRARAEDAGDAVDERRRRARRPGA